MRFVWASPNKWVWVYAEGPLTGAMTDGTTKVIIENGVAVLVTDEGKVHAGNRLTNLFRPRTFDYEGWELGPVTNGTVIGRAAWLFTTTPSMQGKAAHEVVFDADSGVILCMRTEEAYLGFEELELDQEIPDETFQWDGPIEPLKVGTATVIPEIDGSYSVFWEVSRGLFHHDGPRSVSKDEAIAWGEARAAHIHFRSE